MNEQTPNLIKITFSCITSADFNQTVNRNDSSESCRAGSCLGTQTIGESDVAQAGRIVTEKQAGYSQTGVTRVRQGTNCYTQ